MNRTSFLIVALVILLIAGVLLVMGIAGQKSQTMASGPGLPPATAKSSPASTSSPSIALTSRPTLPTLTTMLAATLPTTIPATLAGPLPVEPGTHDPVMIKEGDTYYVFYTGGRINTLHSKDLIHWDRPTPALPGVPNWIAGTIPANRGDLWAPDISLHDGKFFLYYAASTFGSNTSGIGLATTKTLNSASPDYKWDDVGLVMASKAADFYNCIDPNAFFDNDGTAWLTFGSFYWNQGGGRGAPANPDAAIKGGIQLVKLNPATGLLLPDAKPQTIASRAYPERAIEAPFLIKSGDWYYLFVSWDRCCAGLRSTYRIMAGRARKVTGPYLDKLGVDMVKGGGTEILAGDGKRIIGPGHQGLFKDGDRWLMVHHFYDGNTPNGTSRLQVRPMTFDDQGWPVLGKSINSPN